MMLTEPVEHANVSFILPNQTCQRLTLAEIELATNNFDEALVIGHGGFGNVYRSISNFGSSVNEVAIKRLHSTSNQGAQEFEAEVKLLSTMRHGNLVPLIGYCSEVKEMILAYEFMPNGTLEDHLHKGDTELSWLKLLEICIGAARGLDYLHTGTSTQYGVIHRDVKTSNILLDSNFAARVSDFGLAKVGLMNQTRTHVSTLVKGTFGYMDPCYFYSGNLTRKSDVYAFGVVLFEVLSGKRAVDPSLDEDQWSLAVWAQDHFKAGRLNEIINHRLVGQISKKGLKEFASIALHCLHSQPKQRPTMADVVVKLSSIMSQERESVGSGVPDGRIFNKVRYLFTGKVDSMPAHAEGDKSERRTRVFTYGELVSATRKCNETKFTRSLKTRYRGWVDKLTIAPTKPGVGLAMYVQTKEIEIYDEWNPKSGNFKHPNLVKLLGYYLHDQKVSCVYELNPSLDKLLYGEPGRTPLSWVARLKIAIGAAEGLSFLHRREHRAYKHFKTASITVDADYNARLENFEYKVPSTCTDYNVLSFIAQEDSFYTSEVVDGFNMEGYTSTDFLLKGETYYFGVVLLEILAGRKVYDRDLDKWATPFIEHEVNLGKILDPYLQDNRHPPKGAYRLAKLVSNCLQKERSYRPLTGTILEVLRECYQEAITPKSKTN